MPITYDDKRIYLDDNPPARSQFRVGRRDPVRSVIVVHTAESGTDLTGPDLKAESVAGFIVRRSTPGSYHLLGDADSIIRLIRFENEAFHDRTGSNRWAIGISLAMNAGDWPTLPEHRRQQFVATAAEMAVIAGSWLADRGVGWPEPVLLTKQQSDRSDASGFISHGRRDPGRRSDPGVAFPWLDFFEQYRRRAPAGVFTPDSGSEIIVPEQRMTWEEVQQALNDAGFDAGTVDGDPWTKTRAAFREALTAAQDPKLPDGLDLEALIRKAAKYDRIFEGVKGIRESLGLGI
jgi:N-acetyl-anhydromuramyl-L-alanine amidase AmpD